MQAAPVSTPPGEKSAGHVNEILDERRSAAAFIEAVVRQLAYPPCADDPGAAPTSRSQIAEEVTDLLRLAQDSVPDTESRHLAARLAEDPTLLSIFFQNIDLLYEHAYPGADALSRAIMGAIELLEQRGA